MPVAKLVSENPSGEQLSLAGKWKDYQFKNLTQCDLSKCTKSEIKEYFKNTYDLDELLFSAVQDEYLYKCPDRLRLPLIFYLPHPSSVYINKLILAGLLDKRVNAHFEKLFETGVDEMSWDDTENYRMGGSFEWPALTDVLRYRNRVREVVNEVIDTTPLQLPVTQDSPWWSVFMGMEHERIHFETSSVLIRQLPVDVVKKPENWIYAPYKAETAPGPNNFVKVPTGPVVVGKPTEFPSYGWDNEYGRHEAEVPEFEASQYLVTNEEFLGFVNDGGYSKRELWTEEGWKWCEYKQAKHPLFWVCEDECKSGCGAELACYTHCKPGHSESNGVNGAPNGTSNGDSNGLVKTTKYRYRAMFDVLEMPWYWPAEVNYHEAKAFCKWKGPEYRLPSEAEHHRMRGEKDLSLDVSCDPTFDSDFPANINLKFGSSTPVNMYPPTSMGLYDVFGNVWEWTEDHFNGLPGFKTTYLYDDFSSPCFDGRHTMIMGGSWVSTGNEASRFARYAFRRHFFQHAGFRLARSAAPLPARLCNVEVFVLGAGVSDNPITAPGVDKSCCYKDSTNTQFQYETEEKLQQQLLIDYGQGDAAGTELVACVDAVVKSHNTGRDNAILFGCGTGRDAFMLTQIFDNVVAVDYCGRFLDAAIKIQSGQPMSFEGGQTAVVPPATKPDNVKFLQLTWVPNEVEGYNVAVFQFIDRLSEPKGWLLKLWEVVTPAGMVVFITARESKWDQARIGEIIGNRFDFKQQSSLGEKIATVWKRKQ